MKRIWICLLLIPALFVLGCGSDPKANGTGNQGTENSFNPESVSQEMHDSTLAEVRLFIESLNRVISSNNFDSWKSNLSDSYLQEISSADFLQKTSDMPALKTQKVVLKNVQDYFKHVVVPSRASSRVDDIEFVNQNRVRAFTINARNERLRLYELEHIGGAWKITN